MKIHHLQMQTFAKNVLSEIESLVNESGDKGLSKMFDKFLTVGRICQRIHLILIREILFCKKHPIWLQR